MLPSRALRSLLPLAALALAGAGAHAQNYLSGEVYDGNGGPLLSGEVYQAFADLRVPAGQTLTVQAGAILKLSGALLSVDGSLVVDGTSASPAWFSSIADDSVGGDTNGDGPSTGEPGDWKGIDLAASSSLVATGLEVAYGGTPGAGSAITFHGGVLQLTDCGVRQSSGSGLKLSGSHTPPALTRCRFEANAGRGIDRASLESFVGMSGVELAGNGGGDLVRVSNGALQKSVAIGPENCPGGAFEIQQDTTVPAGIVLAFDPGVRVVWTAPSLGGVCAVYGELDLRGLPGRPVVFDGAWSLQPQPGGAVEVHHSILRGGIVDVLGGSLTVRDSRIEASALGYTPIDLEGATQGVSIVRCTFEGSNVAIRHAGLEVLPFLRDNTPLDHPLYTTVEVAGGVLTGDATIGLENLVGAALHVVAPLTVPAGRSLSIGPGVILQLSGDVEVHGSLNLSGSARDPVQVGPARSGFWGQLAYRSDAEPSELRNVLMRLGKLRLESPLVSATSIHLEMVNDPDRTTAAIYATALAGNAENWVVDHGYVDGIFVGGPGFDLVHASVNSSHVGIVGGAAFSGRILSSISWNNFSNANAVASAAAFACDGFGAAANGNISKNPLWSNPSGFDLRLEAGSPCIDRGNVEAALSVGLDIDERSRLLDSTLSGKLRPDMGAYERALWELVAEGDGAIGSLLRLRATGPSGVATFLMGVPGAGTLVPPYGVVVLGPSPATLGTLPVGRNLRLRIPHAASLVGTELAFQALVLPSAGATVGGATNRVRIVVGRPETAGGLSTARR